MFFRCLAGCVQLDVRGTCTYPARPVEACRAGANGSESRAGERSRRTGERRTFQGVAGEARASEGVAREETRATEGGSCEETCATETRTSETRAPKRGTGKAGSATSASIACTCEGRVVRTDGTLPRSHRC